MAERKTAQPRSKFVEVNGAKLHCLEWPDRGRPLVFIHANSYCGGVFAPLAANLSDSFHVFALDMRETLLVGHSRGGGATVLATAACPERVRGVVLYEPNIAPRRMLSGQGESHSMPISSIVERAMRRRTVFSSRQELFDRYSQENALKRWTAESLWAYIEHGTVVREDGQVELLCPPWVEAQLYREMLHTEAWAELLILDTPMLACHGDTRRDIPQGHGLTEALRAIAPGCQFRAMPGATHFGPMEQPEAFEAIIREFESSLD